MRATGRAMPVMFSALLLRWHDLDAALGIRLGALLGALLLQRPARLLGHVLPGGLVGHRCSLVGSLTGSTRQQYAAPEHHPYVRDASGAWTTRLRDELDRRHGLECAPANGCDGPPACAQSGAVASSGAPSAFRLRCGRALGLEGARDVARRLGEPGRVGGWPSPAPILLSPRPAGAGAPAGGCAGPVAELRPCRHRCRLLQVIALPMRLRGRPLAGSTSSVPPRSRRCETRTSRRRSRWPMPPPSAIVQARLARSRDIVDEQLQTALNSRPVIEQAKGVLSAHLDVSPRYGVRGVQVTCAHDAATHAWGHQVVGISSAKFSPVGRVRPGSGGTARGSGASRTPACRGGRRCRRAQTLPFARNNRSRRGFECPDSLRCWGGCAAGSGRTSHGPTRRRPQCV
jgi:hypothetical protein